MDFKKYFDDSGFHSKYGDEAILLVCMGMLFPDEELDSLYAENIVDGPNDKKIDFIKLDDGVLTIAQGAYRRDWSTNREASANKASDLNTSVNWLLTGDLNKVPSNIRTYAEQVRDGIKNDEISRIQLFYVHNLKGSANVNDELVTCKAGLRQIVNQREIDIFAKEYDILAINDLYLSGQHPILVTDAFSIATDDYVHEKTTDWEAVVTSVDLSFLKDIYTKSGDKLFSSNIRDFLGRKKSARNINNNIVQTIEDEPESFWIYNNGVTALTHKLEVTDGEIRMSGLSIINGAQTTGAIAEADTAYVKNGKVLLRIITTTKLSLLSNVVKFNNTQNTIYSYELRSGDRFQKKLQSEFLSLGINYVARRTQQRSTGDTIKATPAAQAMMAFHGKPLVAMKGKTEIFEIDKNYGEIFHDNTTASHIAFVYSIVGCYESFKKSEKLKSGNKTDTDVKKMEFMSLFSFKQFLIYCIGQCVDLVLDKGGQLSDSYSLAFKGGESLSTQSEKWKKVVPMVVNAIIISSPNMTTSEFNDMLKSESKMRDIAGTTRLSFETQIGFHETHPFSSFSKSVLISKPT